MGGGDRGLNPLHPKKSAHAMCSILGGRDDLFLEGLASCHFLSPEIPQDSTWASALVQGGTAERRSLCQEEGFYHLLRERELGCQAHHTWPGIIIVIMATVIIATVTNIY